MKSIIGERFGRLIVIERVKLEDREKEKRAKASFWLCKCDCGNEIVTRRDSLKRGVTQSCGCLRDEVTSKNNKARATHGLSDTRFYNIWFGMKKRCYNEMYE